MIWNISPKELCEKVPSSGEFFTIKDLYWKLEDYEDYSFETSPRSFQTILIQLQPLEHQGSILFFFKFSFFKFLFFFFSTKSFLRIFSLCLLLKEKKGEVELWIRTHWTMHLYFSNQTYAVPFCDRNFFLLFKSLLMKLENQFWCSFYHSDQK